MKDEWIIKIATIHSFINIVTYYNSKPATSTTPNSPHKNKNKINKVLYKSIKDKSYCGK